MHYSRHRLTAAVAYVTKRTCASTNERQARLACPPVSSSKTKPCHISTVQLHRSLFNPRPPPPAGVFFAVSLSLSGQRGGPVVGSEAAADVEVAVAVVLGGGVCDLSGAEPCCCC